MTSFIVTGNITVRTRCPRSQKNQFLMSAICPLDSAKIFMKLIQTQIDIVRSFDITFHLTRG